MYRPHIIKSMETINLDVNEFSFELSVYINLIIPLYKTQEPIINLTTVSITPEHTIEIIPNITKTIDVTNKELLAIFKFL